jgi:hypothetical protein
VRPGSTPLVPKVATSTVAVQMAMHRMLSMVNAAAHESPSLSRGCPRMPVLVHRGPPLVGLKLFGLRQGIQKIVELSVCQETRACTTTTQVHTQPETALQSKERPFNPFCILSGSFRTRLTISIFSTSDVILPNSCPVRLELLRLMRFVRLHYCIREA